MTKHFEDDINSTKEEKKPEKKMSLLERMRKTSTIKESEILTKSKFFHKKDMIQTKIPALNVALSGELDGGFVPGITIWAGPSRHFKSLFSLIMAKSYMDKYPDAVMVFMDSEFGTNLAYFASVDIDMNRVLHIPIMNLEEFKHEMMHQLEEITVGEKVIFVVDSLGNMASKKEVDDAIDGKSVADMTRAKVAKSVFRMITPYMTKLDIPMVAVAHTYQTQETYSKTVVSGGTGIMLGADNVFVLGRQQEKDGTDHVGYNFIINVEKSRYSREKSKIPIQVKFEGGLSVWSGLLDMAVESGCVIKPSVGWFSRVDDDGVVEDKKFRAKDTDTAEFWKPLLTGKNFKQWVSDNYKVSNHKLLSDESTDYSLDDLPDEDNE